jgi:peroxiredoxin
MAEEKPRRRGLVRFLPEVVVFVIVIGGVYVYRTQDMLNADYQPAPQLSLTSLGGDLTVLEGGKPALVYFFAPWCNICGASAHNIRNLRKLRDDDQLQILLVALDWQVADEVVAFVERHELAVDVLLGQPQTARDWGVSVFPTYYILDERKRVAHRDFGYSTLLGLWIRSVLA